MQEEFDAIVVGAGPSGSACALTMAKAGLSVLLIERGRFPGEKNVSGGVLYGQVLHQLVPNFWEEAPIERHINRRIITFLSEESGLSIDFKSAKFNHAPYIGFSILRAKFDRWLAEKAEAAGATLVTELLVENVVKRDGRVVGVEVAGDKLFAKVVIAADGVLSRLSQQAGLRSDLSTKDVNLGIKEVLNLSREKIDERFGLRGNEGIANEFVGYCTRGVQGGAFLYTNAESLSLGVIVQARSLIENQFRAIDLLHEFKKHPVISPLVDGGELVEYSAHLIPERGLEMSPQLYTDGMLVVGDAAGFVLAAGLILEGNNFALGSGIAAANAVIQARTENNFSKKSLARYERLLKESFVLQDLKTYQKVPQFLENPRMYKSYPDLACAVMEHLFDPGGLPRKRLWRIVLDAAKGKVSFWQLLKDGIKGARTL